MDKTETELFEEWHADPDGSAGCQENLAKDGSGRYLLTEILLLYAGQTASRKCNKRNSIDRSIPNIGETVIVHTENGNIFSDIYAEGYDGGYFETAEDFNEQVTHWQPLPMSPQEEQRSNQNEFKPPHTLCRYCESAQHRLPI